MATAKKSTAKRKNNGKKTSTGFFHSFKRTPEPAPFLTFKVTDQTIYWLILSLLVLSFGIWVMYLNVKIENIYNQIELNSSLIDSQLQQKEAQQEMDHTGHDMTKMQ